MFISTISILTVVICFLTEWIKSNTTLTEKYSTNIIVGIISLIVGWGGNALFYIFLEIPFTLINICYLLIMGPVLFFVATVGYDKVVQTIKQVKEMADKMKRGEE
jgi:hypothetical protein